MIRVSQLESVRPTAPRHPVGGYSPTHSDQKNVKTRAYSPFRVPNCDNPKPDKSGRNTRGGGPEWPLDNQRLTQHFPDARPVSFLEKFKTVGNRTTSQRPPDDRLR